jgi:hypothetical protein
MKVMDNRVSKRAEFYLSRGKANFYLSREKKSRILPYNWEGGSLRKTESWRPLSSRFYKDFIT